MKSIIFINKRKQKAFEKNSCENNYSIRITVLTLIVETPDTFKKCANKLTFNVKMSCQKVIVIVNQGFISIGVKSLSCS